MIALGNEVILYLHFNEYNSISDSMFCYANVPISYSNFLHLVPRKIIPTNFRTIYHRNSSIATSKKDKIKKRRKSAHPTYNPYCSCSKKDLISSSIPNSQYYTRLATISYDDDRNCNLPLGEHAGSFSTRFGKIMQISGCKLLSMSNRNLVEEKHKKPSTQFKNALLMKKIRNKQFKRCNKDGNAHEPTIYAEQKKVVKSNKICIVCPKIGI